ncbi:MAG: response regulator containing CheY-like receiver, AAA-type ATPase, and DNA-binding domain protein [Halonotius sp. J07HN6]|nr:MAG: response regulator containing CheY-like receiver, AAA-type ATPase, and DNA-binding domain protein [Halonotius sp. J07HN6]
MSHLAVWPLVVYTSKMSVQSQNDEPTVVIVDDEERVAKCYKLFINDRYEAHIATGGQEALDTLTREVEVILLDRRMPEMHGHEVLDHIHAEGYDCRVIIISALDPDMEVLDYQFSKYLKKPIVKEQLLDTIEQVRMLDRYESLLTEYYQAVEKYSIMQSEFTSATLENNAQFQELEEDISHLRAEIDETLSVFNETTERLLRGKDIPE